MAVRTVGEMYTISASIDNGKETHNHGLGTDAADIITVNHHGSAGGCGAGQILYIWTDKYVLAAGAGTITKSIGCIIPDGDAPDITPIGHIEQVCVGRLWNHCDISQVVAHQCHFGWYGHWIDFSI